MELFDTFKLILPNLVLFNSTLKILLYKIISEPNQPHQWHISHIRSLRLWSPPTVCRWHLSCPSTLSFYSCKFLIFSNEMLQHQLWLLSKKTGKVEPFLFGTSNNVFHLELVRIELNILIRHPSRNWNSIYHGNFESSIACPHGKQLFCFQFSGWHIFVIYLCSGSIVVTTLDRGPCRYSEARLTAQGLPVHPFRVVHWVPEQLNMKAVTGHASWFMVAA